VHRFLDRELGPLDIIREIRFKERHVRSGRIYHVSGRACDRGSASQFSKQRLEEDEPVRVKRHAFFARLGNTGDESRLSRAEECSNEFIEPPKLHLLSKLPADPARIVPQSVQSSLTPLPQQAVKALLQF